jgi:serine/threonine protein kinase
MFRAGDRIGPYTLLSRIGRGSFGVIWLAERRTIIASTRVALKIPVLEDVDLEAIKKEAELWVQASGHPNVLPIIEANVYDGQVVIASEYAPDGSLQDWLKHHGGAAPTLEEALRITGGILYGLVHLHSRKIIHRDLKPANILLQGNSPRLADFGISRVMRTTSQSAVVAGTPAYMAPETFRGRRNERTDLWAVGVILYQLISGRLPFSGDDLPSLMAAILTDEPAPLGEVQGADVSEIVRRALQRDPSDRYSNAAEMAAAVQNAAGNLAHRNVVKGSPAMPIPEARSPVAASKTKSYGWASGGIETSERPRRASEDRRPRPGVPATADTMVVGEKQRSYKIWNVVLASSVGNMIEWYDFYIFGSLAATISPLFYPKGDPTFALIAYLVPFAVGFVVRPFGALFFGRIGDLVGRKYAFLVTLTIMGGATFLIGLMPTYDKIGVFAPITLILIRALQGLALGGEYGGAAVYVAEQVPDHRRGFYTSFIQMTATLGLLLSLAVILLIRKSMSPADFSSYGWRLPFLISIFLVGISLYVRLKMKESPIFNQLKKEGKTSTAPIKESFANKANRKVVAISLFGATAGQGVVWYTGQFYAWFYMQIVLKVDPTLASYIVAGGPPYPWHAALRRLRLAVRQNWPQEDNDGGLRSGRRDLLSDLQRYAGCRRKQCHERSIYP